MRSHPAHDPEFRKALALSADEQRTVLEAMAGLERPPVPAAPLMFQPAGMDVYRTARTIWCDPQRSGDRLLTRQSDSHVAIVIEHDWCLDTPAAHRARSARNRAGVAEVERRLADITPRRGLLRLPFLARVPWAHQTFGAVIRAMVLNLPDAPADPATAEIHVCDEKGAEYAYITARAPGGAYFSQVSLAPAPDKVSWGRFWWNFSGTLGQLEALIHKTKPEPQRYKTDGDDDDEYEEYDDEELSCAFERDARRALHGNRGKRRNDPALGPIIEKLRRLLATNPSVVNVLSDIIDNLDRGKR